MGREVRRVPPNWQHPMKEYPNHRLGRMEQDYQPMRNHDAEEAFADWQAEYQKWLDGEHERIIEKYGEKDYPKTELYRAFCKWHRTPPDPEYYRPKWNEEEATWWQVYETVSEGTPVTPPFATPEELIDYLATHGDFWDQRRRAEGRSSIECGPWDREAAQRFVTRGWAPTMMVSTGPEGTKIQGPRDMTD